MSIYEVYRQSFPLRNENDEWEACVLKVGEMHVEPGVNPIRLAKVRFNVHAPMVKRKAKINGHSSFVVGSTDPEYWRMLRKAQSDVDHQR